MAPPGVGKIALGLAAIENWQHFAIGSNGNSELERKSHHANEQFPGKSCLDAEIGIQIRTLDWSDHQASVFVESECLLQNAASSTHLRSTIISFASRRKCKFLSLTIFQTNCFCRSTIIDISRDRGMNRDIELSSNDTGNYSAPVKGSQRTSTGGVTGSVQISVKPMWDSDVVPETEMVYRQSSA